jgi:hypothetical protein
MKAAERRIAERKEVASIEVAELTSLAHYRVIARAGQIVDASTSGILMHINRKDLVPKELRENLSLHELLGQHVVMFLPQMNLDLDGRITRADHKGRGMFEIGIQFSEEVPLYWRECLIELLPAPGEIEAEET